MTHPPAGPSTPTPPPGPRSVPLDHTQRIDNYWRQNGTERLTPRQRRRAEHKACRAFYRPAL